jgi:hypothetical protein
MWLSVIMAFIVRIIPYLSLSHSHTHTHSLSLCVCMFWYIEYNGQCTRCVSYAHPLALDD